MERTDNRVSRLQTKYTYIWSYMNHVNVSFDSTTYHVSLLATSDHLINLPSSLEVLQVLLECRHKCWEGINWEPKDFPQHLDEGLIYVEPETQKGTLCVRKMQRTRKRKYAGHTHSCWWCYLRYIITVIPQRCHFWGKLLQKKGSKKFYKTTSKCILCTNQDSLVHTIMECSKTNLCQSMLLLWDGSGANY